MPAISTAALRLSASLAVFAATLATAKAEADLGVGPAVDEIIVTGRPLKKPIGETVEGVSVLSDDDLMANLSSSLGAALAKTPGVSQSYFGPGASRPILRGLSGDRVRMLVGGIGSIDASSTSPDHGVVAEPILADRIEVVRGPATLLYGSSAEGGVVNVMDGRIPTHAPNNGFEAGLRAAFGSNADEAQAAGAATFSLGERFAGHVDGYVRHAGNIVIPGPAWSDRLQQSSGEIDPDPSGSRKLSNSDLDAKAVTAGVSTFFAEDGYIGVSISRNLSNYGVPQVEDGHTRIDLAQTRADLMGEVPVDTLVVERVKVRFGWADYSHKELDDGAVATTIGTRGWEGRVEFIQATHGGWRGAFGIQANHTDLDVFGAEAFITPVASSQFGLFALEEYATGPLTFTLGGRFEHTTARAVELGVDRSFNGFSTSAGVTWKLKGGWLAGLSGFFTRRAPTPEELFSDGPHNATETYQLGTPTLAAERARGAEIGIKKTSGIVTGSLNLFTTHFGDFVYERFTGDVVDDLPVAAFSATTARFSGFEAEARSRLYDSGKVAFVVTGRADYVRARDLDNRADLPRIPPLRLGAGAELTTGNFILSADLEHATAQKDIAAFETPTDGYTKLDANVTWRPFGEDRDIAVMLEARNLTDAEIRYSTSFLKDKVPAPGRDIRLSLRATF